MTEPKIYFVRHGESETNATGILAGQRDVALTKKGIEQARELGSKLKAEHFHADTIIASDLKRAHETAEIIAEAIGYDNRIVTLSELRESYAGDFEGRPYVEYRDADRDEIAAAGGESREAFAERVIKADELVHTYARGITIVIAHDGVHRMMKTLIAGKPPQSMELISPSPNATLLEYPALTKIAEGIV